MIDELAKQLGLVLGVLGALFVGPGLAIAFLLIRRARTKARRRSPIGIKLLRGPGHTLREQLDNETGEVIWDLLILSALPLLILALYLAQAHLRGWEVMKGVAAIYVTLVLAFVAWLVFRLAKRGERLSNLRAGYDAEVAIGQELDTLMRRGATVFHDFPADGFNIDHVVITPTSVYAVETKGYTKLNALKGREGATVEYDGMRLKFPMWTTEEPILQAERNAKWLGEWIRKAAGHSAPVHPVVALPGWFVKERGVGAVKVYSGRQLSTLLDGPLPELDARTQSITFQVEQRCRTVVPTYKRDGTEKS
jgi:hypothetical protein